MKIKKIISFLLFFALCICISACGGDTSQDDLWKDASYTNDAAFGNGAKIIELEVKAGNKSVTFTINTDADNLEDALTEHNIIDGDEGPYGIYIKKVNGITADYDVDQSYWSLSKNGEPLMSGASGVQLNGGEHFEFVYTK